MHPEAQISAEAVECAGLQGKFWAMHDQVFLNQAEWSGQENALQVLLGYGAKINLDENAYQSCLSEHQTAEKVMEDYRFGQMIGVQSTPSFLFNSGGQLQGMAGAYPYEQFQQIIDAALQGGTP